MKTKYFIDLKQRTDETHPVHSEDCPFLPERNNRIFLGILSTPVEAELAGRIYFNSSVSCPFCCSKPGISGVDKDNSHLFTNPEFLHFSGITASAESALLCGVN